MITNGTTTIGFATARQFIHEGARVMIVGESEAQLAEAAEKLGRNTIAVQADVRSLTELDKLADRVKENFDGLDLLFVNNRVDLLAMLEEDEKQFYINIKGVFFTVQKLAGLLNDRASIILNSLGVNQQWVTTGIPYFATKTAVRSFARSISKELAPRKIRVNALSPGIVCTQFESPIDLPQEAFEQFIESIIQKSALGGESQAEKIAKAAVFVASHDSLTLSG